MARPSRSALVLQVLVGLTLVLTLVSLYAIANAPVEKQMGIIQKIFYFHFPSAYCMYLGFTVCAVASAVYLAKRDDRWDAIAVAAAEVGVLFCAIVLTTGPIWGRKAWGTYWTWDPRITSTLLAGMIYVAYVVLRSFGPSGEVEKRFAAGLGIFGLLDIPVIHYSVQRWRGTHPTVVTGKGGGLHPDMYAPLILSFVTFTLLFGVLVWQRARTERLNQRLMSLETRAAEAGLLEET